MTSAHPIASFLRDFSATTASTFPVRPAVQGATRAPTASRQHEPDIATLIADAVTQAEESMRAKFAEEHEKQIEALRQEHQTALEAMRTEAEQRESDIVAQKLVTLEKQLIETLGTTTGQVLVHALTEPLLGQALDSFAHAVAALVGDENAVRVHISAPPALIDALKPKLEGVRFDIVWREAEIFDLEASCNGQIIGTRLTEWSQTLSGLFS